LQFNEAHMRKTPWIWCLLFLAAAVSLTAAPRGLEAAQRGAEPSSKPEPYVGTWPGTWEGGGSSGGFELTVEQAKDGALTGKVAVTGEPTYNATLKSIAFDGKKMTGRYDFPADDSAEVVLAATFDGNKATGTWSLRTKSDGAEAISGTWTVTRK
jgi:hypothetical protein